MSVIQPEWLLELAPHYYETRKSTHDVEMDSDIEEAVAHSKKERRKRSKREQVRFTKLRPSPPPHVTRGVLIFTGHKRCGAETRFRGSKLHWRIVRG